MKEKLEAFDTDDPRVFAKKLKRLATVTAEDRVMTQRQLKGQLRIGDVVVLTF